MTSPKLPTLATGIPRDIRVGRKAYDVFMKVDLPSAKLPHRFVLYAQVKEKEWDNLIESYKGPVDRFFFTPKERNQGNVMLASSAGVILAFEKITKRQSAARAIFAQPAKGWHIWTPVLSGLVGLVGSYYVIGRQGS